MALFPAVPPVSFMGGSVVLYLVMFYIVFKYVLDFDGGELAADDRAAISYVDAVLTFGTLVMIAVVSPMLFTVYEMLGGVADPLTSALLDLAVPLLIIALIISMGVAARA